MEGEMMAKQLAYGRQWSATQLSTVMNNYSLPQIKQRLAFQIVNQRLGCQRCGQVVKLQARLTDGLYKQLTAYTGKAQSVPHASA